MKTIKIGIIICDRYKSCAGGKCFRAIKNREGAFSIYSHDSQLEVVAYTTCGGCPGGNVEYTPEEMIKNGAETIHLATGLLVGYPPCPYIEHFIDFVEDKYGIKVIPGTHPIPEKYYLTNRNLRTWSGPEWEDLLSPSLSDEKTRLAYD